ncbi:MAG: acyl-CoA dehydrogenase [Sphingobacteriales bacterium]|nr:acyl-CoA dehydrogenase [Sphingobacteriales bacterium]
MMSGPCLGQVDGIRKESFAAEKSGSLTPAQLDIIYRQNWFNIFVPRHIGGLELSLPEGARLQESLAWADGSFGWTITLCSGANWFAGFLEEAVRSRFFSDPKVCFAGSGAATGIAEMVEGGFIVDGRWRYATGAKHATAFTANCIVHKDGTVLKEDNGSDMIRSFVFERNEVKIVEDWNSLGMNATSSHSFEVDHIFVAADRVFMIDASHAILPGLVYKVPFLQFAEVTLAANFSGMALHFSEECRALFEEKIMKRGYSVIKAGEMLEVLGRMSSMLEGRRKFFHETVAQLWEKGMTQGNWNVSVLEDLSMVCKALVKTALKSVDELYPYTGMTGADPSADINRIWRDIHTASQHQLFTFNGIKLDKLQYSYS